MEALIGEMIDLVELSHVEDLIYYDGPLLSVLKDKIGNTYLLYWCDCSDDRKLQRYMLARVSEQTINDLKSNKITIYQSLVECVLDPWVIIFDYNKSRVVFKVELKDVPDSYKPRVDTFLEYQDRVIVGEP